MAGNSYKNALKTASTVKEEACFLMEAWPQVSKRSVLTFSSLSAKIL
jgi:hypothetical protein